MNKHVWKKWAAVMSCCALAWGSPASVVWASESNVQSEEGMLDRAAEFYDRFCSVLKMKVQLFGTPVLEPYVVMYSPGNSRSDEDDAALYPQPMPGSTLLSNHRTRFAWGKGKKITSFKIKEADSGKTVYTEQVANKTAVSIVPKDAGMEHGRTYYWELAWDAGSVRREMRLLDAALEEDLRKRLPTLDSLETYEEIDRQMLQAAYLVSWSDNSNGEVDLHWLALELMQKPEAKHLEDETSAKLREILLNACGEHLDKRLS